MKFLRPILLGTMILTFWAGSTQGAPLASWSVSLKLGEYQPAADGFSAQYPPQAFRGDIELGYKISRQVEAGVSVGYFSDNAPVYSVSGRISALNQELTLIPTQIYLTYQIFSDDNQFLVPYIGGGYTHITYRHSVEGEDAASGGIAGYHLRGGLKILLNRFEPDSARKLYD
ncbi:MAG TPA: hypothetical protein VN944_10610, partial [Nitrospiria bacterium]|nr:hypothetical protein [Nitrospiria bacterium]